MERIQVRGDAKDSRLTWVRLRMASLAESCVLAAYLEEQALPGHRLVQVVARERRGRGRHHASLTLIWRHANEHLPRLTESEHRSLVLNAIGALSRAAGAGAGDARPT